MAIEIFWGSGSPYSWRVLLALELKGLPYESRLVQFSKAEHKTPEYLAMNPRGKVPVLRDGSYCLYESTAILAYLDRKYPEPPLFGRTPEEAGKIWRIVSEYGSYLDEPVESFILPIYRGRAREQADQVRAAADKIVTELGALDATLANQPFLAGEAITAADLAVFPGVMSVERAASKPEAKFLELGLIPLESRFARLAAWVKRIQAIPGYERTYPPHWRG